MKTLTLTFALVLAGFIVMAQENTTGNNTAGTSDTKPIQTLLDNTSSVGAIIGFTSGYSIINSKDACVGGVNLGLVTNHSLVTGIAGRVFGCTSSFNNIVAGKEAWLGGGYGGLYLEPILSPKEVIHLSFPFIMGVGCASYIEHQDWNSYNDNEWDDVDNRNYTLDSDGFFILEPGVQIEMNVASWLRLGVGASYRYVYGLDLKNTPSDMLDGYSTNITVKFGKF